MSKLVRESDKLNKDDDDELSDCSMASFDLPAPKVRKKELQDKKLQKKESEDRKKKIAMSINLLEQLGGKVQDEAAPTSSASSIPKGPITLNLDPFEDDASSALTSVASSVSDNEDIRELQDYFTNIEPELPSDECPICHEPVTPEEFHQFFKDRVKNTTNNTQFCRQHKKNKILKEGSKYPEIDWTRLQSRIAHFQPRLIAVLKGEYAEDEHLSLYRIEHGKRVATGKNRSRRVRIDASLEEDNHTGYYGDRGYDIMMEKITTLMSTEITEQAKRDPIFRSSSGIAFTAGVLVPELAICLVKQDFECDETEARRLIKESAAYGRVAHPSLDDDIALSEGDDE